MSAASVTPVGGGTRAAEAASQTLRQRSNVGAGKSNQDLSAEERAPPPGPLQTSTLPQRKSGFSSGHGGGGDGGPRPHFIHRAPPRLYRQHRKMSFPAAAPAHSASVNSAHAAAAAAAAAAGSFGPGLHAFSAVGLASGVSAASPSSANAAGLDLPELAAAQRRMRRFSNVSDAVSRKLSTTIGWRTVSVADVVDQAKSLCGQYIRSRLKRAGLFHRKLGLQRLRSTANLPGGFVVCEVFGQLQAIGAELERLHPKLYSGVGRQVSRTMISLKTDIIPSDYPSLPLQSTRPFSLVCVRFCIGGHFWNFASPASLRRHPSQIPVLQLAVANFTISPSTSPLAAGNANESFRRRQNVSHFNDVQ